MGAQKIWKEKRVDNGQCKHGAMTFQVSVCRPFFRYSDIAQKKGGVIVGGVWYWFLLSPFLFSDERSDDCGCGQTVPPPPSSIFKKPFYFCLNPKYHLRRSPSFPREETIPSFRSEKKPSCPLEKEERGSNEL